MRKLNIDMWYRDSPEDADRISITFYPNDGEYRGNIYKEGKCIGDYWCKDSLLLERVFPKLEFNWG